MGEKARIAAAIFAGLILCQALCAVSGAQIQVVEQQPNHDKGPDQQTPPTTTDEVGKKSNAEICEESTRDPFQSLFDDLWDESRTYWVPAINSLLMGPSRRGRYSPRTVFGDMFSDMGSGFMRTVGENRRLVESVSLRPIANDEKAVVFAVKLAGVPRENVTISVDAEGLLTVDAKYREKSSIEGEGEAEYSYFAQRQLPYGIDAAKVSAEYKDGLLKITVPKPSKEDITKVTVM